MILAGCCLPTAAEKKKIIPTDLRGRATVWFFQQAPRVLFSLQVSIHDLISATTSSTSVLLSSSNVTQSATALKVKLKGKARSVSLPVIILVAFREYSATSRNSDNRAALSKDMKETRPER